MVEVAGTRKWAKVYTEPMANVELQINLDGIARSGVLISSFLIFHCIWLFHFLKYAWITLAMQAPTWLVSSFWS